MRTWKLVCRACGKKAKFSGAGNFPLAEIVEAYQAAGWFVHNHVTICPVCLPTANTDLNA
jgi:hypothetical protein